MRFETAQTVDRHSVDLPNYVRSHGIAALDVGYERGGSTIASVYECGASRLRFPNRVGAALEVTLVNVGGGIAGGDQFDCRVSAGQQARVVVSTAAAERVYCSLGAHATLSTTLNAAPLSHCLWLPQELILYQGAKLRRRIEADCAHNARMVISEMTVLGRTASGEIFSEGELADHWRIRRDGRLIFADNTQLSPAMLAKRDHAAVLGGYTAFGTTVIVDKDAIEHLEKVRDLLAEAPGEGEIAASAWNGMLLIRARGHKPWALRQRLARLLLGLGLFELPRVWG